MSLVFSPNSERLNAIASKPGIFEKIAVKGQDRIDLASMWDEFIGLECESGGFLLHRIADCFYEAHTLFPVGTGVIKLVPQAFEMAFCGTDATELCTRVPRNNTLARRLAEKSGWVYRYQIADGWNGPDGVFDVDHYGLYLWQWIVGNSTLINAGERFHARLVASGHELTHADDPVHDAFVGYVDTCNRYGYLLKGVHEYNRWALVSGYMPVMATPDGGVRFGNVVAYENRIEVI